MATIQLGSLSEDGWITSTTAVMDNVLSHFFLSDYSQTQLYVTKVSSMSWVIHEGQGDIPRTISLLQSTLQQYLLHYFNNVTVEVSDGTSPLTPSQVALKLYVSVVDTDGKDYTLGRTVPIVDGKLGKVLSINNYGTESTT